MKYEHRLLTADVFCAVEISRMAWHQWYSSLLVCEVWCTKRHLGLNMVVLRRGSTVDSIDWSQECWSNRWGLFNNRLSNGQFPLDSAHLYECRVTVYSPVLLHSPMVGEWYIIQWCVIHCKVQCDVLLVYRPDQTCFLLMAVDFCIR